MAIRKAAVIVPLQVGESLRVYIVRRSPELAFLGGFHTFPGGSVDPVDRALAAEGRARCAETSAAQRELFEELGILTGELAHSPPANRDELRRKTLQDAHVWHAWIASRGGLPEDHLKAFGRWTTPEFSQIRFDAQYFAAIVPGTETPDVWPGENTEGDWWGVEDALVAHDQGRLFISYPVIETLKVLLKHGSNIEDAARALEFRDPTTSPMTHGDGSMLTGIRMHPVRTPTLPPATHTNVYILGREDLVVIDPASPFADEQDRLCAHLRSLQSQGKRLREIWLTHHHPDHIGAVERLRTEFDLPVATHTLCADDLRKRINIDRFIEDEELNVFRGPDGIEDRWRALHTPGHAKGHLCFYEERLGTLVSGDLVLSEGTVVIAAPDGDMSDYFASLRRLLGLPKHGFLLPAHGPPLATTARKIQEYLTHRLAREEAILKKLKAPHTIEEIVSLVYPALEPRIRTLAEATVERHLAKLRREGRVEYNHNRWVNSQPNRDFGN